MRVCSTATARSIRAGRASGSHRLRIPFTKLIVRFRSQVTLADRQADEASPLFSAKTFEQLNLWAKRGIRMPCMLIGHLCSHPDLLRGIYAMGFNKPSKIQERALPLLLSNPYAHCIRRLVPS